MDEIKKLFSKLNKKEQVEVMVELYFKMSSLQKDTFLLETEN